MSKLSKSYFKVWSKFVESKNWRFIIQAHLKKKKHQRLTTLSKFISVNFLIIFFDNTPFVRVLSKKKRIDRSIREKFKFNIARNTPQTLSAQLLKIPPRSNPAEKLRLWNNFCGNMLESCEKPVVPFAPEIPFHERWNDSFQKVSIPSISWDAIENNKRRIKYCLRDISKCRID